MSFTEFSYMTLQAADFLHLHRALGVDLQMGGADQWGNITAGLELIRRVEGREEGADASAFGLCSPLLLTRAGVKMGKSERGAVFLDPALTSPYEFYQYWLNDDDLLVVQHLRWLTLLSADEIAAIEAEQTARPGVARRAPGARVRPDRAHPRPRGGGAPGARGGRGLLARPDRRPGRAGRAPPGVDMLDSSAVSYALVLTKKDEVKKGEIEQRLAEVTAAIARRPAAYPHVLFTSSDTGEGIPELRAAIMQLLAERGAV